MKNQLRLAGRLMMLALVASGVFGFSLGQSGGTQTNPDQGDQSAQPLPAASSSPSAPRPHASPYVRRSRQLTRARRAYDALWGIDNIEVKEVSSGIMLRLSYRILDANKAKALHEAESIPYLIDEKTGAVLQVPDMPKVGVLRPKLTPVDGKEYWMVFSNKGLVKPGNRVDVVIGRFRADGLVVQ